MMMGSLINQSRYEDFIGIYETRFDCSLLLNYFEYCERNNIDIMRFKSQGPDESTVVKDSKIDISYSTSYNVSIFERSLKPLNDLLGECVRDYSDHYDVLKLFSLQNIATLVQRTRPGEGYHQWHFEDGLPGYMHRRKLTWMLYLNDVEEGGETEFLYYHKRIQPKQGTLLIWPVNFTHAHRGNPPLKVDKYAATGWLESPE